jgi:shikimate kinase
MPGVGKSTVARRLGARLGRDAIDLDDVIAAAAGRDVSTIFADEGEAGFRRRESAALRHLLDEADRPLVVACGGGVVLAAENRELLAARATTVLIEVRLAVLADRLAAAGAHRPLLQGDLVERLAALDADRGDLYGASADLRIDAGVLGPDDVVERIVAALA